MKKKKRAESFFLSTKGKLKSVTKRKNVKWEPCRRILVPPLQDSTSAHEQKCAPVWSRCIVSPSISFFSFRVKPPIADLLFISLSWSPLRKSCANVAALGLEIKTVLSIE